MPGKPLMPQGKQESFQEEIELIIVLLPSCLCSFHFQLTFPYKVISHEGRSEHTQKNCFLYHYKNKQACCWPRLKKALSSSISAGDDATSS